MKNTLVIKSDRLRTTVYLISIGLIAAVWLINGMFCKVLMMVPRHAEIVAAITGSEYAIPLTRGIGIGETIFALWIVSGYRPRTAVLAQVVLIGVMNIIEFFTVPQLLIWGQLNLVFAVIFILFILFNEFILRPDQLNTVS
ncbi:MAG: DoxX-like family protein [Chitinophagaceae bacterium]